MKVKTLFKVSYLSAGLILTGCAPMNSKFDCDKVGGEGAGCVSLDAVNQMANEGKFSKSADTLNTSVGINSDQNLSLSATNNQGYPVATPSAGSPIWHDADKQRIWLAPWVDSDGNFHDSAYIYFKLNNGYWVGNPGKAINTED